MNIAEHLPAVGLGALAMGIAVLVRTIVSLHRRRDREQADRDFRRLGHTRKLVEEEKLQPRLKELAVALGGRGRRGGLDFVLRGSDIDGRWFFTRRKVDGEGQVALLFECKLLTVNGLRIAPMRPQVRGFSRFMARLRRRPPLPLHLRMEWESPADGVDERSARMGSMLYQLMAQARHVVEPMGVHVHVNAQRVAIHSRRPLEGDALRVFADVAGALRKRILQVPQASGALRLRPGESRGLQPIEGPVTRAVQAVGLPNDKSGPALPYGPLSTEPDPDVIVKNPKSGKTRLTKLVRHVKTPDEDKVEVIPSNRY